jgi:hypothetical protein
MADQNQFMSGGGSIEYGYDPEAYDKAHPKKAAPPVPVKTDAAGRPTTGTVARTPTPLVGKATAARAFDSFTLGLGEKAVGLVNQHAADEIKKASADYDADHPWASAGIDLLMAGTTMAIPGLDAIASGRAIGSVARLGGRAIGEAAPAIARTAGRVADSSIGRSVGDVASRFADSSVGKGARYGAVAGGIRGGTDSTSDSALGVVGDAAKGALTGGTIGAAGGAVAGQAGRIGQGGLEKAGALSAAKAGAANLERVLKAEGKSIDGLNAFMEANPSARMADYSKNAAALVAKAGRTTGAARERLDETLRADAAGQPERLRDVAKATPLAKTREEMTDEIDRLTAQRDQGYASGRTEITPITPELKAALDHPAVAPLLKDSLKSYANLRKDVGSDVARAPKYKEGTELPSAVLEDVQKAVGKAMKAEGTGTTKYGELQSVRKALKSGQTGSVLGGQAAAAILGKAENETGVLGAAKWGYGFSQAQKSAPIESFRNFTDLQKEHARLGVLEGVESYFKRGAELGEGKLKEIAAGFKNDEIREVLGPRNANQLHKAFLNEAARLRTSAAMQAGAAREGDGAGNAAAHVIAHAAGHFVPGGHAVMATVKTLIRAGMTGEQAKQVIDMAARPGYIEYLKKSGADRRVLDALYTLRGGLTGGTAAKVSRDRPYRESGD